MNPNKQDALPVQLFASLNRYAILHRIQTARKAETRTSRFRKYIQMLEKHERIYS